MANVHLYFGGNKKGREEEIFKKIKVDSPDVHIVKKDEDKKSIGIDKIRDGIKFLQEKPFELKNKFLIIEQANLLTTEAQNALLKTLEEPPTYADIRLGTKAEKDLLETVVSRCKRIDLNKEKKSRVVEEKDSYEYAEFKNLTIGQKLDYLEDLAKEEKEDIVYILENWIAEERLDLIKKKDTTFIEKLIKVKKDLESTNMNTKFVLEYLVVTA